VVLQLIHKPNLDCVPQIEKHCTRRSEWSTSHPGHFTPPPRKNNDTHGTGDWVGPSTSPDILKNEKNLLPFLGLKPRSPSLKPSFYTSYIIQAPEHPQYNTEVIQIGINPSNNTAVLQLNKRRNTAHLTAIQVPLVR